MKVRAGRPGQSLIVLHHGHRGEPGDCYIDGYTDGYTDGYIGVPSI